MLGIGEASAKAAQRAKNVKSNKTATIAVFVFLKFIAPLLSDLSPTMYYYTLFLYEIYDWRQKPRSKGARFLLYIIADIFAGEG